ncbi:MAG: hypothetical protein HC902_10475 [Calothrix sp. SM1_5_4]|nr:hypothetical protein [Calothrix sp. SM1_5_4]
MVLMDIPVGFASVFTMILIGYFVLTVWFGKPSQPVVQHSPDTRKPESQDMAS